MAGHRAVRVGEAAAHRHGRKHRGRDVLLDLDTTRTGTPFLLRREREIYNANRAIEAEKLLKRLETNIVRCNGKAVGRILGEILKGNACTPEQVAEACNRALARLRGMGKGREAFLMGAEIRRLTVTALLENGESRGTADDDPFSTNDAVAECFRERVFPNRIGGRP